MLEALTLPFFQRVLLAGLFASIACGLIGTYVVAKRMSSLSGGISHAAFGGVGLGYLVGFSPMVGALGFGLAAAVAVGLAYRRLGTAIDTVVSMVWSVGMALGVLFIALAPGYAPDLTSYLFGSLLFVPWPYVYGVAALDALIVLVVVGLFRELEAVSFDEEFAETTGLPVEALFLGLLGLTALAIVTLIRVVGVILAIALLTIPAVVARQWTARIGPMMVLATTLAAIAMGGGLVTSYVLSYSFDVSAPPGPLVILWAAALYLGSSALRRWRPAQPRTA